MNMQVNAFWAVSPGLLASCCSITSCHKLSGQTSTIGGSSSSLAGGGFRQDFGGSIRGGRASFGLEKGQRLGIRSPALLSSLAIPCGSQGPGEQSAV